MNDQLGLSVYSLWHNGHCAVLVLGFFIVASGCGLKTRDAIIYHSLNVPPPDKEFKTPIPQTLMIYRFSLAPAVESDSIPISQSKGAWKSVQLHRWQENPADLVTDVILRDFDASGLFQKTIDQLSNLRYRYALEGTVLNMHGVIKNGQASALIELEAVFTDFEAPRRAVKELLRKTYKVEIPSRGTSPEAILSAFSLGVAKLSALLRADISSVLEKSGSGDSGERGRRAHLQPDAVI
jgi:ABC-type uncharacterized transport system auxiliary subunit